MLRRLVAEVQADRRALGARDAELDEFLSRWSGSDAGQAAALALVLDRSYSGLEALMERVVRTLDGDVPRGTDWHRGLLDAARLHVPTIRPAILAGSADAADELRRFRHFVRHAYAAPLDPPRVRTLAAAWSAAHPLLSADLDAFEAFLEQLAATVSP